MRFIALLMLVLAACSEDRPPAPTAEESERLNEAGAMLDDLAEDQGEASAERSVTD